MVLIVGGIDFLKFLRSTLDICFPLEAIVWLKPKLIRGVASLSESPSSPEESSEQNDDEEKSLFSLSLALRVFPTTPIENSSAFLG